MITLRRDKERHYVRRRKQEVWHTFYPENLADELAMGFGTLEFLIEDRIPPGEDVQHNPNRDSEILTYVLQGALAQEDSTGDSGVIRAGEFQRMTTGMRVRHSERNASQTAWAHVFRMSLHPSESELDCSHEQKLFPAAERSGVLCIVASPDRRKGSLYVHQDALIYSAILKVGQHLIHEIPQGRIAWLHIVRGEVTLGDLVLATGDSAGVTAETSISFTAWDETEILLLDLNYDPKYPTNGGVS